MLDIKSYLLLSLIQLISSQTLLTPHGSSEISLKQPAQSRIWPNLIGLSRKIGIRPARNAQYILKKKRGRLR
jgi:hypothetical protein